MDKSRTVNTKFWTDSYIENLNPSEKLLFLYLLTNPYTNILGIYEVSRKRIKFETDLNDETVRKALERFEKDRKVICYNDWIMIPNFLNHQKLNTNMKKGVVSIFNELPQWLQNKILGNDSKGLGNDSESFEKIRNTLLKIESESESESEKERESEKKESQKKFYKPSLQEVKDFFRENGYRESIAEKAYNYYSEADWHDSQGKKVRNWKQKMRMVWFKEEHKIRNNQQKNVMPS